MIGDQIALIALVVVVHTRTGSAFLSAAVFAAWFIPALFGGPLVSALADRMPRRRLMVICDLGRGGLVAMLALPFLPIGAVYPLMFAVALFSTPFDAARSALLPEILAGERYVAGTTLMHGTYQVAQIAGFLIGGLAVSAWGATPLLLADAATFVVSAVLLTARVRPGFIVHTRHAEPPKSLIHDAIAGARVVFGDSVLRSVMLLAWTVALFAIVPEALAASYATSVGGDGRLIGMMLAAPAAGAVLGVFIVGKYFAPRQRVRALRPLAVLALAPVLVTAFHPPVAVVIGAWVLAGVGASMQLPANIAFVAYTPASVRGRAFGLAQSGVAVVQGVGYLAAGAAAQWLGAGEAIALAGAVGLVAMLPLLVKWPRELIGAPAAPRAISLDAMTRVRTS